MPWDDKSLLRITPWPQAPLPHPGHSGFPYVYSEDADALIPDFEAASDARQAAEPTTELYLKLAALDPGDIPGLVQFARSYGLLDMRAQYSTARPIDGWMFPIRNRDDVPDELVDAFERAVSTGDPRFGDTITEIRFAILYMRDLIAMRRVLDGEIQQADHIWEAPFWSSWTDLDSPPWTREGPAAILGMAMSDGLAPYSPHLRTFFDGEDPVPVFAGDVSAWNVCCLELFNHIVAGAKYKTCANETCGRLFVRQEGRARHDQHRSHGVKFCSPYCARAQAQRQYRRRQRSS